MNANSLTRLKTLNLSILLCFASTALGSIDVGGILNIDGEITLTSNGSQETGAAENLDLFIGEGALRLENGDVNPLARGLLINNATAGVVKVGADYAVVAYGSGEIVGVDDVALAGDFLVKINMLGSIVNETIAVQGTSETISVSFPSSGQVSEVGGLGIAFDINGQAVSGDVLNVYKRTITRNAESEAALQLDIANAATSYQKDGTLLVSASQLIGDILLMSDGSAASFVGNPGSDVISLSGIIALQINSSHTAVDEFFDVDGSLRSFSIPAGPLNNILAQNLALSIAGQGLIGSFSFSQTSGGDVLALASDVSTSFLDDSTEIIAFNGGEGFLLLTDSGTGGNLSGSSAFSVPGFTLAGNLNLQLNTGATPISETVFISGSEQNLDLPPGPFVSLIGESSVVTVSGQELSGNFSFNQIAGSGVYAIAESITNAYGSGASDLISLTDAEGLLLLYQSGVAASITGATSFNDTEVTTSDDFTLRINNTGELIDQTVLLPNGSSQTVSFSPAEADIFRLEAYSTSLMVSGQSISGDFSFAPSISGDISIEAYNISSTFSDEATAILSLNGGAGRIALTPAGTGVSINGSLNFFDTEVATTGTGTLQINNTVTVIEKTGVSLPAGPYVQIVSESNTLSLNGQSITGDFNFQQIASGDVVAQAFNASSRFNDGVIDLISMNEGNGILLLKTTGTAAVITGSTTVSAPGTSLAGTLNLEINTTSTGINQTVNVSGSSSTLSLPSGPFVQFSGQSISLEILDATLFGNVTFSQASPGNVLGTLSDTTLAFSNGSTDLMTLSNGLGGLVMDSTGTGVTFSGETAFNDPELSISGALTAKINSGATAIVETVNVSGFPLQISLPAGPFVQISGDAVSLGVDGETLSGDFIFENIGSGIVHLTVANGSYDQGVNLVQFANAEGSLFVFDDGIAGELNGLASFNIPGASISATPFFSANTTGRLIDLTLDIDGEPVVVAFPSGEFIRLLAGSASINIAEQSVFCDLQFEASVSDTIALSVFNGAFDISSGVLSASDALGVLAADATGVEGALSIGSASFNAPSVLLSGFPEAVQISSRASPAYFRVPFSSAAISTNQLLVGGSPAIFSGDIVIDAFNSQARLQLFNTSPFINGTSVALDTGESDMLLTDGNLLTILPAPSINFGNTLNSSLTIVADNFEVNGSTPIPLRIHPASLRTGPIPLIDFSSTTSTVVANDFAINPTLPTGFNHIVNNQQLLLNSAVKLDSDDDGLSDEWEDTYTIGSDTTSLTPDDNSDGDLLPAIAEFALGLDPTISDSPTIETLFSDVAGQDYFSIRYPRNPEAIGLIGIFTQRSADLALSDPWSTDDTTFQNQTSNNITDRSTVPVSDGSKEFLRLQFLRP